MDFFLFAIQSANWKFMKQKKNEQFSHTRKKNYKKIKI